MLVFVWINFWQRERLKLFWCFSNGPDKAMADEGEEDEKAILDEAGPDWTSFVLYMFRHVYGYYHFG